jgi:hypothetical protein
MKTIGTCEEYACLTLGDFTDVSCDSVDEARNASANDIAYFDGVLRKSLDACGLCRRLRDSDCPARVAIAMVTPL